MYIPETKVPAGQHDWNQLSRNKTVLYVTASDVSRTENISSINRALRYSSTDVTLTQHHQPCQLTISVETVTHFSLLSNIFISTFSSSAPNIQIWCYNHFNSINQSINQTMSHDQSFFVLIGQIAFSWYSVMIIHKYVNIQTSVVGPQ